LIHMNIYMCKLALTSPTGGGRSVGIVRSLTMATEFSLEFSFICKLIVKLLSSFNPANGYS